MWAADDLELIKLQSKDSSRMLLNASRRHSMLLCKVAGTWDKAGKMSLGLNSSVLFISQQTSHDTVCITITQRKLRPLLVKKVCCIWVLGSQDVYIRVIPLFLKSQYWTRTLQNKPNSLHHIIQSGEADRSCPSCSMTNLFPEITAFPDAVGYKGRDENSAFKTWHRCHYWRGKSLILEDTREPVVKSSDTVIIPLKQF